MLLTRGGQTFSFGSDGGNDDVDSGEEEDVSEANILVSEVSKLSAGARIFRGPSAYYWMQPVSIKLI